MATGVKTGKKAREKVCKSLGITVVVHSGQPIEITPDLDFEQLYIPEDGLYELAFESHASGARKFRKWVTQEVLPTIRQTGAYVKDTKKLLALAVLEANKIIQEQEQKIKELQPKAEYFDKLVDRNLLTNFRDTAKELNIPERKLIQPSAPEENYLQRCKRKSQTLCGIQGVL